MYEMIVGQIENVQRMWQRCGQNRAESSSTPRKFIAWCEVTKLVRGPFQLS
jgi:hypothetical protein